MAIGPDSKMGFLALSRFGYGARASSDDLIRAGSDPRGFLLAELQRPDTARIEAVLPGSREGLQALFEQRQRIQLARQEKADKAASGPDSGMAEKQQGAAAEGKDAAPAEMSAQGMQEGAAQAKPKADGPRVPQQLFRAEALARFQKAASVDAGFVERLVQFW
jgi:uncharacterized protein (DUF1800 family)